MLWVYTNKKEEEEEDEEEEENDRPTQRRRIDESNDEDPEDMLDVPRNISSCSWGQKKILALVDVQGACRITIQVEDLRKTSRCFCSTSKTNGSLKFVGPGPLSMSLWTFKKTLIEILSQVLLDAQANVSWQLFSVKR